MVRRFHSAADLVTGAPVTVAATASLTQAAAVLVGEGVGVVVVQDDTGTVGVLSERDVMRELVAGRDLDSTEVATAMSIDTIVVQGSTPIEAAARTMSEEGVRHLIVAEGASLLGVISARDVIDWYVASEPYREVGRP